MCLLQNYFLFQSYETFRLCDINDLSRLGLILTTILNAAKSCTEYQASKSDYEAVLHFLSYFKSKGQHPIKIESQGMLTINGMLNMLAHIANISLRVYTFSYFLQTSVSLSLTCLCLVFGLNLMLVRLFPQHLLEIHQNAPYGISTSPSYWTDRVTDIFVNVSTRYNKFTHNKILYTRIPLILVQLLHFFIPITVCFTIAWLSENHLDKLLHSVVVKQSVNSTNLRAYLDECPELNEWYGSNELYSKLGAFVFPMFQSLDNRFSSYNDVFNVIHLIWLLFYAQILTALLYSFSLNGRLCKAQDYELYENFPVIVSYGFYSSMFDQLLKLKMPEKLQASRKLMVLTLLHPHEFYSYTNLCFFGRKQLSEESVNSQMDKLVDPKRLQKSPQEVENDLKSCRNEKHVLLAQFNALENSLISEPDRALFLIFRSYFDRKMYATQSITIERVFELMGFQKRKNLV
ncbi:hypothetical protein Ocin01_05109 [Orchesella cincta]|uniref:Uncharacterized protein n=1 Tax=Orchesella cincta TaxID=48709 RepID=A0A1D2N8M4_ORCCI|nr:hypothetical protein Ocin01_05109 [Orchesella cincta]